MPILANTRRRLWLALIGWLWFSLGSAPARQPPIKVEHGWVRAVPPAADESAAYMTFINDSDAGVSLTSITSPIAGKVVPMLTTRKPGESGDVVGMKAISQLLIPAHGQLVLDPGETHLMLIGLKRHPKVGETVSLTLHFGKAGDITLELPVVLNRL